MVHLVHLLYPLDINQEAFCSWLCLREHTLVGQPGTCYQSPLALWLSEVSGHVYGVDGSVYGRATWDYRCWLYLPRWALLFTRRVEVCAVGAITGAQAFAVLAQVEMALVPQGSLWQGARCVGEVTRSWR
ncbi:MAG TPA: hypothetical protein VIY29_07730 [Ktedonobacteraceae bacterium]